MKPAKVLVFYGTVATAALLGACGRTPSAPPAATAAFAAYRSATGGNAWHGKTAYRDVTTRTQLGISSYQVRAFDLRSGSMKVQNTFKTTHSAYGFDGRRAWVQDAEGIVRTESGAAARLAADATYVDTNQWWQPHFAGAKIASAGKRRCGDATCTVTSITPKGGAPFQAWFNTRSHMLVRVVQQADGKHPTWQFSDYQRVDGVLIPFRRVFATGPSKLLILRETVESATFLPEQSVSAFATPQSRPRNIAIANGATQTTFPFRLIVDNIYAKVRVNGHAPATFIFDTGGKTIVSPAAAKASGVAVQPFKAPGAPTTHAISFGAAVVQSLDVGNAHFTRVPVPVFDVLPTPHRQSRAEGMIGYSVFNPFVARFDYTAHRITLIKPTHFNPRGAGVPIPFKLIGTLPVVEGAIGGIHGKFVIDTGEADALLLTSPFVARHHLIIANPHGVHGIVGTGMAGPIFGHVTRLKSFTVGPFKLQNVVTVMSETRTGPQASPAVAGMIGNGILRHFTVTLDYATGTAYFKPSGPLPDPMGHFNQSGLACVAPVKTGLKIWCVTPQSPAQRAGMELGQIITEVNGKPATLFTPAAFTEMMRHDPPGTVFHIVATQGTITHNFTLTLRNLL